MPKLHGMVERRDDNLIVQIKSLAGERRNILDGLIVAAPHFESDLTLGASGTVNPFCMHTTSKTLFIHGFSMISLQGSNPDYLPLISVEFDDYQGEVRWRQTLQFEGPRIALAHTIIAPVRTPVRILAGWEGNQPGPLLSRVSVHLSTARDVA